MNSTRSDRIFGVSDLPPFGGDTGTSEHFLTLGRLPQARDRILVLVQRDDKPIGAVVVLHDLERVVRDVAQELDVGFDAPVVLVRVEKRVFEEEAGLVPAHFALCQPLLVSRLRSSQKRG